MEDYSTPSQRSKVTLSNWVRLNNARDLLSMPLKILSSLSEGGTRTTNQHLMCYTWESAGYMRSCRYNVAVVTVQDTTLDVVVLGGSLGSSEYTMTQRQVERDYGTLETPPTWNNKTSIVEKCTVN